MTQTVEERIGDLVTASNQLTTAVEGKVAEIDSKVDQGIASIVNSVVNGQGEYTMTGAVPIDTWVDIGDLSSNATFTINVLSTENSNVQPQEWAFVYHFANSYDTSIRVDNYSVLHAHSNDLFFRVNLATKTLQVKKTLNTSRQFSVHLKINTGLVTMRPSQTLG